MVSRADGPFPNVAYIAFLSTFPDRFFCKDEMVSVSELFLCLVRGLAFYCCVQSVDDTFDLIATDLRPFREIC